MQDLIDKLETLQKECDDALKVLDLESLKKKRDELEVQMQEPGFWDDSQKAQSVSRQHGTLKNTIETWETFQQELEDALELSGILNEVNDTEEVEELRKNTQKLSDQYEKLEIQLYLNGKYDGCDAVLSVHAGAGGTDASDWAEMVLRMYTRYAENKDWKVELLDRSDAEEAGIKSASLRIEGDFVFGLLKEEAGVHRLVRLSPFNSKNTRETSFCKVEVIPEIETHNIKIKDEDLKVDTYRASGHGGQSVNTTDSAVRITHLPTNIVVTCQNERSQLQNKENAMKTLVSKLIALQEKMHLKELDEIRGDHVENAWGSQIRSYVLHPYQMVKDHRTEHETSQVETVLSGDANELDLFIEKSLKSSVQN